MARAGAEVWSNKVAGVLGEVAQLLGSVLTSHGPHPPEPPDTKGLPLPYLQVPHASTPNLLTSARSGHLS